MTIGISLIQQYLAVLCIDNAVFLAERYVASCGKTCNSLYLLALCYYRSAAGSSSNSSSSGGGSRGGGFFGDNPGIGSSSNNDNVVNSNNNSGIKRALAILEESPVKLTPCMSYLLARCYYDTNQYGLAEDILLNECRKQYQLWKSSPTAYSSSSTDTFLDNNHNVESIDEWIMSMTPCPIPNGAAGLNLLGNICRKLNRKNRSIDYYYMSLKLDPLLFTSYEALCEMGVTGAATSKYDLDPINIFGVLPKLLQQQQQNNTVNNNKPTPAVVDGTLHYQQQQQQQQQHHHHQVTTTPDNNNSLLSSAKTPTIALQNMGLETPSTAGFETSTSSRLPRATSLFHSGSQPKNMNTISSNTKPPPTSSSSASRRIMPTPTTTGMKMQQHLHQTSGAFTTPNLTPILHNKDDTMMIEEDSGNNVNSHSSILGSNPYIIRRARNVASHLYYEPPIESTPPPPKSTMKLRQQRKKPPPQQQHETPSSPIKRVTIMSPPPPPPPPPPTVPTSASARCFLSGLDFNEKNSSIVLHNTNTSNVQSRVLEFSSVLDNNDSVIIEQQQKATSTSKNVKDTATRTSGTNTTTVAAIGAGDDIDHLALNHQDRPEMKKDEEDSNGNPSNNIEGEGIDRKSGNDTTATLTNCCDGVQVILELLCVLGSAQHFLCQYRCREAIQIFHLLPQEQYRTGYVLHQVGRAYFEMADYNNAMKSLQLMSRIESHRMKGLEVLSTTLWHLKKEVELSHLAQRCINFDRMCPESWCVVGNCFSLQKEHETSITFFKRSIQLDPSFTYSYTLSGHEYVANEDFDKAVVCYRDAIRVDETHYNAWYGLGAIYYRQEKYDLAEYHFKRALMINKQSSVLYCHLGMAQHANGKSQDALATLGEAFRLDPRNPQAKYQRATIYVSLDRPHDALVELQKVRDAAPREASVHFAMGRVLKRIGKPEQAMRCFLTALDLDPKDNNLIKAAMDKMDEPDVDEEVSAY